MSSLVENINMQMEAETGDLVDRRMMQLFAVAHNKFDKSDVQNASKNLAAARNGDATSVFGDKLTKMIQVDGIPELGLHSNTELPLLHHKQLV